MTFEIFAMTTLGFLLALVVLLFLLRRKKAFRWMLVVFVVALFGFCSSAVVEVGAGSFPQNEFQITFTDREGQPLEGVELQVQTMQGHNAYLFPITDHAPEKSPKSDKNGLLVCHHVARGVEFTERTRYVLFFPINTQAPPDYWCIFSHEGREVKRLRYGDLWRRDKDSATVKRTWKWREVMTFPEDELAAFESVESLSKRDGEWIRDLSQAYLIGDRLWMQERFRRKGVENIGDEELTFNVVQRTIRLGE